ncbi:MAG: hypothetical protein ACM3UN_03410 [Bacillota bacterium]
MSVSNISGVIFENLAVGRRLLSQANKGIAKRQLLQPLKLQCVWLLQWIGFPVNVFLGIPCLGGISARFLMGLVVFRVRTIGFPFKSPVLQCSLISAVKGLVTVK